ncbi:hypothetical protein MZO42_08775 [Sphingomonas psychrotolerans]|uniref:Helix-turn-helix domain-containing protein n=1 Tax=Sphingomonas psychrotolerans TaxID=1327635 RepID=A0ABU3N2L2_9SPHN|nr:hypothetical protein [Sphingomonas psychrotolerans]MDT8758790.1 hypothetical protein [Sphingomonas psychrotolerans]
MAEMRLTRTATDSLYRHDQLLRDALRAGSHTIGLRTRNCRHQQPVRAAPVLYEPGRSGCASEMRSPWDRLYQPNVMPTRPPVEPLTVEPATPRAPRFEADPALQNALVHRSAAFVFAHGSLLDPHPAVQYFTTRDCGYLVLTAVIAVALAPEATLSLSYRSLARQFRVSRSHIGNLMAHAARERWFAIDGRGRLTSINPDILESYRTWAARQMAHQGVLANAILATDANAIGASGFRADSSCAR